MVHLSVVVGRCGVEAQRQIGGVRVASRQRKSEVAATRPALQHSGMQRFFIRRLVSRRAHHRNIGHGNRLRPRGSVDRNLGILGVDRAGNCLLVGAGHHHGLLGGKLRHRVPVNRDRSPACSVFIVSFLSLTLTMVPVRRSPFFRVTCSAYKAIQQQHTNNPHTKVLNMAIPFLLGVSKCRARGFVISWLDRVLSLCRADGTPAPGTYVPLGFAGSFSTYCI